jgi:dienelactone hydrolase
MPVLADYATMIGSRRQAGRMAAFVVLVVIASGLQPALAQSEDLAAIDCAGWLGTPGSGSQGWLDADRNNVRCAGEGYRMLQTSPAEAAATAANVAAGDGGFVGDPFRAPHRWSGTRGSYERLTYTDRDGAAWPAALFGPRDAAGGPFPGVLLVCHACFPPPNTTETVGLWYWAAESLAEAGYVVLYAAVGGNSVTRTVDATDFFTATPTAPTSRGEFNPWYARLDRDRLGIIGHSGAAGVALNVGNADPRFDAIVGWDPASSATFTGITPRVPTMIQTADYTLRDGPVPRDSKPVPDPNSKYTFFDAIRAAGVDVMQIAPRASTHLDWTRFAAANPFGPSLDHGIYGEMVATYYTLAWLDRYVAKRAGTSVRRRLTVSGQDRFDRSADRYSIGSGVYDPRRAKRGDAELGNVPVTIGGMRVRNLLSFEYPSRYFLDGGRLQCDDVRAGCP